MAALVLSVISLCLQYRPPSLSLSFNTVAASVNGGDHYVIPVTFANSGGEPTTIRDVMLVESYAGATSTYVTWFSIKKDNQEAFLREGRMKGATTPYLESDVFPFTLFPGSQVTKLFVFNHFSKTPALLYSGRSIRYRILANATSGIASATHCITWSNALERTLATGGGEIEVANGLITWRDLETPNGKRAVVDGCR